MTNDILPPKWVYVSMVAEHPGPEHTLTGPTGHQYQKYEWLKWVVVGTRADAQAQIDAVFARATGGRKLVRRDTHFYPNNYKVESRRLIRDGRVTA